ncbi:hypothetical protein CMK22_18335 [Candidatus Poribacteria bacterium]|nr:hypothetical protein [Candidatus Poribacteria bacterium]|tara:strand:+ start:508 stop:1017 length:510 start_codon:yes stop_codon:yes gene_type:complete
MLNRILYTLKLKKRPPTPDKETLVGMHPLRNQLVEWEVDDRGEVVLKIPQTHKKWLRLMAKIFKLPPIRVVVLDEVGSHVWQLCDGYHNIKQIVKSLRDRYKMTRKEAETSLFSYMQTLGKRGIIGFAMPQKKKKVKQPTDKEREKRGEQTNAAEPVSNASPNRATSQV